MKNENVFMTRAINIALKGIDNGGGPFGAVIVKDGEIISEEHNRVVLNSDPTAHAEVIAIRVAAQVLKSHDLSTCVIYASCEPCPMCMGAIYWAGIKKVVYACNRIDAEEAGFSDNFIYEELMLDPERRKITFRRLKDAGGKEVFKKWDNMEGKISY